MGHQDSIIMHHSLNIWPYRHLIMHKAWSDFRAESERNRLGMFWWILDPVLNIAIYYVVFGMIFSRGGTDFIPFLTIGITGWLWFNASVSSASKSILSNVSFVREVSLNKLVFPICQILVCTCQFGFALVVLFGVLVLSAVTPTLTWLLLPPLLLVELLLIMAVSLPLCALTPFMPDLASLVTYALRALFFFSCVMYSLADAADAAPQVHFLLQLNPIVHVLNSYRAVLLYNEWPDWSALLIILAGSGLMAFIGARLILRFNPVYAKRIVA